MKNMTYDEFSAMMSSVRDVMNSTLVTVEETTGLRDKVEKFGVNWGCCGTQNIEETKKFAEQINKACRIVEKLNAMEIHVNYKDELRETEFFKKKDFYKNMFENI